MVLTYPQALCTENDLVLKWCVIEQAVKAIQYCSGIGGYFYLLG